MPQQTNTCLQATSQLSKRALMCLKTFYSHLALCRRNPRTNKPKSRKCFLCSSDPHGHLFGRVCQMHPNPMILPSDKRTNWKQALLRNKLAKPDETKSKRLGQDVDTCKSQASNLTSCKYSSFKTSSTTSCEKRSRTKICSKTSQKLTLIPKWSKPKCATSEPKTITSKSFVTQPGSN